MPETLAVRRGTREDAERLADIGRASFVATFAHLYRPDDLTNFLTATHSPEAVAKELAKPEVIYLIAEETGNLRGYAKLVLATGWPEHARGRRAVELKQLYAAPGASGRGIGAALIERLIEEARANGADEIQLSVWQGNHRAQRFYRRYGFEQRAEIQFRVGEQMDDEFLFAALI